ncbi:MAG: PhzF family phenazine biosynthesis protein [Candidatus Thermoplasmatota archaeon]|nr:PhzF family phenazine biosynthesis protein [Candidatus Thermoplasmatota archaeon]
MPLHEGDRSDFISRLFPPSVGVNDDPVTGSAYTTLAPYWSNILGKKTMNAVKLLKRGGKLICTDKGSRVEISGQAILYLEGEIIYHASDEWSKYR